MNAECRAAVGFERELGESLCRSILYEALSLAFRPATRATLERLGRSPAGEALVEAAAVLDPGRATALETRTRALISCAATSSPESLLESHRRLFGHTSRGPVPAYETEYGEDTLFQKPQEMSDIAGFLKAFGLVLDPRERERLDHVSCELEFLAFLARKEAHAIECGDQEMRAETRRATRLFLKDHLGRFVPSFASRVLREDRGGFYGALAALCLEFVRMECARFDAPAGPEGLRQRLALDDGAPMACGGTEGCAPGLCGDGR
jgi:TorA maturation chaperone TorD